LGVIKSLSSMAAIFHDIGKSNKFFQNKLKASKPKADPHRHEWLSILFLRAHYDMYPEGEEWLYQLALGNFDEKNIRTKLSELSLTNPFEGIQSDSLKLLMWLILSHHRMPLSDADWEGASSESLDSMLRRFKVQWGYENSAEKSLDVTAYAKNLKTCYSFPAELVSKSPTWLGEVKKYAKELYDASHVVSEVMHNGAYRSVLHHARLSLMLADHTYSSKSENQEWLSNSKIYANTLSGEFNQHLDNHLYHVAKNSRQIPKSFPTIAQQLLGVPSERFLNKTSDKYAWQDRAVQKVESSTGQKWLRKHRRGRGQESCGFPPHRWLRNRCVSENANP